MRSLAVKLTLAFVLVSLVGLGLAAVFARQLTASQFDRFRAQQAQSDFSQTALDYYQAHNAWTGVEDALRPGRLPDNGPGPGGAANPPPRFVLTDPSGRVLLAAGPFRRDAQVAPEALQNAQALQVNGQRVGWVLDADPGRGRDPNEERFLNSLDQALWGAALGGAAVALLLGGLMARTLTQPVRELTTALHAMTRGELKQEVPVRSADELGELAQVFNHMSADLARANQLRRQMTADIAHDLRTPLSVMVGYLEALRDGVLPPTPDRFATMYGEARQLQRLVEDLRTLSLAEAGELPLTPAPTAPQVLLERVAGAFQQRAEQSQVSLRVAADPQLAPLALDADRMAQVLGNLVSNALRYTGPGGTITLSAQRTPTGARLSVADTGAGIAPEALPHIFDRFYRADSARAQSDDGQSGLGLAIAKSIVEAHGGALSAASQLGRGATLQIDLPLTLNKKADGAGRQP